MTPIESIVTHPEEMVGLKPNRPFSFCTHHHGAPSNSHQCHGDDPYADDVRAVKFYSKKKVMVPHRHEFYEIVMIRRGQGLHASGNGARAAQPIGRGDVIIVPPGAVHCYEAIPKLSLTNCYISPAWFHDTLRLLWREEGLVHYLLALAIRGPAAQTAGICLLRLTEAQMRQCEKEIKSITHEARRPQPSLITYNSCFQKIFNILNQTYKTANHELPHRFDPRVWKAIHEIERAIEQGRKMNIQDLADQLQMTRKYFTRVFHASVGHPPETYYQSYRIQSAIRLLKQRNSSLCDVACQLGFSDQAHFTRVFKVATGKSPGKFRKESTAEK